MKKFSDIVRYENYLLQFFLEFCMLIDMFYKIKIGKVDHFVNSAVHLTAINVVRRRFSDHALSVGDSQHTLWSKIKYGHQAISENFFSRESVIT